MCTVNILYKKFSEHSYVISTHIKKQNITITTKTPLMTPSSYYLFKGNWYLDF